MSLQPNDLKTFVNEIFTIDSYKSKMGQDKEISVLAFEVLTQDPAKDLMNFIEKGYDFVLDADVSTGENRKGKYDVFVEIERDRHLPKNIGALLDANPFNVRDFSGVTEQRFVKENIIEFGRHASGKFRMEVIEEGSTEELLTKYAGAVSLDETSMSEVLFFTKFMGNYNIQKLGENLFFTNGNRTKILKRI